MFWLNLPVPRLETATKKAWLCKALQRLRRSYGTQHREPISIHQLRQAVLHIKATWGAGGGRLAAAIWIAFLGMLRTGEIWGLRAGALEWAADKQGRLNIKLRTHDKTHLAKNRVVTVAVGKEWEVEARQLLQWCRHQRGRSCPQTQVWTTAAQLSMKGILKQMGLTTGCIRPGGNMFWVEAGLNDAVIHAQGGWAQTSKVRAKHYTSATQRLISTMRSKADVRANDRTESGE
jgi:hypothetical protein